MDNITLAQFTVDALNMLTSAKRWPDVVETDEWSNATETLRRIHHFIAANVHPGMALLTQFTSEVDAITRLNIDY